MGEVVSEKNLPAGAVQWRETKGAGGGRRRGILVTIKKIWDEMW